ncbi:MAG TPA: ATP-binding protein [Roseiflexaceae bacterium]|nr:ATP-binding protein [Roseiflexaceae bacterium]
MQSSDELIAEIQATFGIHNLRSLIEQEPGLLNFFESYRAHVQHQQESTSVEQGASDERQQIAAALQASEARFAATFNQAAVGLSLVAPDGSWLRVNQKLCDIVGYSRDELSTRTFQDLTYPDDLEIDLAYARRVLNNELDQYSLEKRYIHKNGSLIWINLTVSLVRAADGTPDYFISVIEDISERKRAEARLHMLVEASRLFTAKSLHAPDLLDTVAQQIATLLGDVCMISLISDDEQTLKPIASFHRNPEALKLLHTVISDMRLHFGEGLQGRVAQAGQSLLLAEIPDELLRNIRQSAYRPYFEQFGVVSMMIVPIQSSARFLGTMIVARDRNGVSYTQDDVVFATDLADRAALAIENDLLYRDAQQAIHMREVFLSIAAHELRTPLTALLGNAQILERRAMRNGVLTERDQRSLVIIQEQGQRLNTLIETLLDVSRLQLGHFTLSVQLFDFSAFVQRVVDEFGLTLHRHTIHATIAPGIVFKGDEMRMEQVLQNLLTNAVKYSPMGGIVDVRLEQLAEHIRLTITDQGIGIPLNEQSRLFAQFYRASNVDPKRISGLGIGLYLVHEIVAHHGGHVQVESVPEQGSTFRVYLPSETDLPAARLPFSSAQHDTTERG